ncbi:MAG: hypothetical protein HOW73_50600 [Polyangiaceae bacterium]|nr:hypothetical protein [Polyangiaceae bacterium]
MSDPSSHDAGVRLQCLDGAPAPPGLAADLRSLADWPDAALNALGSLIDVTLGDPVPSYAERDIAAFARQHGLEAEDVARGTSAVRALYRHGARADLPADGLRADIRALTTDRADTLVPLIASGYEVARERVQRELLGKTINAHGKVLTDIEWRLETVTESSFGKGFRLPLVTLTLRYQEDGRSSTITFNALPTVVKKIKDALARIVV